MELTRALDNEFKKALPELETHASSRLKPDDTSKSCDHSQISFNSSAKALSSRQISPAQVPSGSTEITVSFWSI